MNCYSYQLNKSSLPSQWGFVCIFVYRENWESQMAPMILIADENKKVDI